MKGISRTYLMDVAVYEHLRRGDSDAALCQLVQNMRAKKQTALDNGSWDTSWLLTGLPDRLGPLQFAGTPAEMAAVAAYKKAQKELRSKASGVPPRMSEDEQEEEDGDTNRKGGGRGKNRKVQAKAAAAAAAAAQ